MVVIHRRAKAVLAIVSAAAIALTGCSRGSGEDSAGAGSADEVRVASLGLGDADTVLALGITPVAVAPWGAQGDGDPSGVGPWAKELLGDAQPEVIYNTASGFTADVLEQVTASDPTQIIAVNQAVDQEAQKSLEEIAPLTIKPEGFEDWQVPWEEQVKTIASAVEKEEEGDKLIDKAQGAFDKFKESHPELNGKRAAIVMPYDGKLGLYTSDDGRGQFIEDLGFEIPQELEGDGSSFFVDYAPENYSQLNNVDYLFVLDYNGAVDELKKDSTFQGLDVVKDGRVRYLETDTGNAMSMPNPLTIPWAVDKFEEQL
ncbi:iron siderophore-binding protein [Corynebacterium sp. HMSC062E11]|uniref:ABC transporter substrate-binding protein n=1 Tax=Corynebacterium guaraldiae TaxID=3051103 RepID=A0ABY3CRD3_9CORY|nr:MULTISPECIES: ABC transporter substrate-binding protein [Corynebacterium]HCT9179855.1 ABC transporter substrate-binding protein [Corynebacterium aurimucosum]OFK29328.1 iron siderophore-binding protein [Corynebacterium sp. HMSC062E11]OFP73876.1 iron siderophore-binding protein [Corynebacterium sp. HMSC078C09]TRX38456.1 ABC transporter substrate-binding protein [Corynebacterium guaraldiae]TRX45267.1 ABC transporter substrate-binding protein [Corynebacterium guaraldiae]